MHGVIANKFCFAGSIETIIKVFSPSDKQSEIIYCPEKTIGGGCLIDIENAKK